MKKTRPKNIFSRVCSLLFLVCTTAACGRGGTAPDWLLKNASPAQLSLSLIHRVVPLSTAVSARGRISAGTLTNLPFRMLLRNDTLQLSIRSNLGSEAVFLLARPDSTFLLISEENALYISTSASIGSDDPVRLAATLLKPLIFPEIDPGVRVFQSESKKFLQWNFENGNQWLVRKADSTVIRKKFHQPGADIIISEIDPGTRFPKRFKLSAPTLEMPIFVAVTSFGADSSSQKFRTRFPAGVQIVRS